VKAVLWCARAIDDLVVNIHADDVVFRSDIQTILIPKGLYPSYIPASYTLVRHLSRKNMSVNINMLSHLVNR
jgi:hypothetical protein